MEGGYLLLSYLFRTYLNKYARMETTQLSMSYGWNMDYFSSLGYQQLWIGTSILEGQHLLSSPGSIDFGALLPASSPGLESTTGEYCHRVNNTCNRVSASIKPGRNYWLFSQHPVNAPSLCNVCQLCVGWSSLSLLGYSTGSDTRDGLPEAEQAIKPLIDSIIDDRRLPRARARR